MNQAKMAEEISTTSQYAYRAIKREDCVINRIFIKIVERLGYDIETTHVKNSNQGDTFVMKKIQIKFDPYNMRTSVIVDGKNIQNNKHCDSKLKEFLNVQSPMPIQAWIDPIERDGWKGLLYSLCQMGDRELVIEFSGRKVDYDDVMNSIMTQNEIMACGANLTFRDIVDEVVPDDQMRINIANVIDLMLQDKFAGLVGKSNSPALIEKYGNLKEIYQQIDQEDFRIVFTGTYSSGKSSAINALIGKNLLPTASGTCTSKVCRIKHQKSDCFANLCYTYKGKEQSFICTSEEEIQNQIKIVEDDVAEIEIYTDLSQIYPEEKENSFRIVIIDTPGTDSATGNDSEKTDDSKKRLSGRSHIEITKEVLQSKNKEMVILVSDDKLEDDNIVELLDLIEESAEEDDGTFNDRFLFVMNMCDSLQYTNHGETLENAVKNFIINIRKVPNSSRVRNIVNPRIYPISSGVALAVENNYTSKPPREDKGTKMFELYSYYKDFCEKIYYDGPSELDYNIDEDASADGNYCLEKQSAVSAYVKKQYVDKLKLLLEPSERLLIHSGVPALNIAIKEYILHYAYPIKVRQLLSAFMDILVEIEKITDKNIEELEEAKKAYGGAVTSKERIQKKEQEEEKRKKALVRIDKKMDETRKIIKEISESIPEINEIRSLFYVMKTSIAGKIDCLDKKEIMVNGEPLTVVAEKDGKGIIDLISQQVDTFEANIKEKVIVVKNGRKELTQKLYDEFMAYIKELEAEGFMSDGSFSLKDTVEYQKLIDKDSFKKAEAKSTTKILSNPHKEHIEFGYGIGNFFKSIGRAWETRKEPDTITVANKYIDIWKYFSDNVDPIQVEVDSYVESLRSGYASDISDLKCNAKERVRSVVELINQKNSRIGEIREEAEKYAADETSYMGRIRKLNNIKDFLAQLKEKLEYIRV
jgi:GTPase SAR1 family protein